MSEQAKIKRRLDVFWGEALVGAHARADLRDAIFAK